MACCQSDAAGYMPAAVHVKIALDAAAAAAASGGAGDAGAGGGTSQRTDTTEVPPLDTPRRYSVM